MLSKIQDTIDYKFKDLSKLKEALTHSSYTNEQKDKTLKDNERLEFLGDAVLEIVISEYLFINFPEMPEGEMTRFRASIVCESMLAKNAREIQIGTFLKLGHGEDATGGRNRDSILADAFEAVIGAVFLDGELDAARNVILKFLSDDVEKMRYRFKISDYKSYLQELVQKESTIPLIYEITKESGPDHNKLFEARVTHNKKVLGQGSGKTKKEAEQSAAFDSLKEFYG